MSASNFLRKVAIVGAGGNSGRYMAETLLKTGKHTVTAVSRTDSTAELPEGVQVSKVDYNDRSSLVSALKGQDALIITLGTRVPKEMEDNLIHAAAEAEVKWVFPNEWGFDTANAKLSEETLLGTRKIDTRNLITRLGKNSWTAVSTGFWYEWSLAIPPSFGFDFDHRTVTLFDEGETRITISTWPQVGRAVASLLSLPIKSENGETALEHFSGKLIYTSSFVISQKDMLESVLRVTKTDIKDWKITKEPVKERYAAGLETMKGGDIRGFAKAMYARVFFPDGSGDIEASGHELSNDALGLPKEDLDAATERAIARAKETAAQWR